MPLPFHPHHHLKSSQIPETMTCGQVHKTDSLDLPKISRVTLKIYSAGKSQGEFVHSLHWSVIFTQVSLLLPGFTY